MSSKGSKRGNFRSEYGDGYNYNRKSSNFEDITSKSRGKRKKGRTALNVFILFLSVVFALIGSGMIYMYNTLDSMNFENIDTQTDPKDKNGLLNDSHVLNVLVFGSDSRTDDAEDGRSDSILMVSIDNRHKKIKLTSFLRDTWINIPNYGYAKLNAAYAYGGPGLAVEMIEKNFGVNIDRYVVLDFESFISVVDVLGGVDIDLDEDEVDFINYANRVEKFGKYTPISGAGVHHLTGVQALAHARNRDSRLSDFDRTGRQRDVVDAILKEFRHASLPELTSIVSKVGPMITTNLRKNEITSLLSNALTYINYDLVERGAPLREECSDEMSDDGQAILVVDDWDQLRRDVAEFIYEDAFTSGNSSSSED